jgi:hypothetical protein
MVTATPDPSATPAAAASAAATTTACCHGRLHLAKLDLSWNRVDDRFYSAVLIQYVFVCHREPFLNAIEPCHAIPLVCSKMQ